MQDFAHRFASEASRKEHRHVHRSTNAYHYHADRLHHWPDDWHQSGTAPLSRLSTPLEAMSKCSGTVHCAPFVSLLAAYWITGLVIQYKTSVPQHSVVS